MSRHQNNHLLIEVDFDDFLDQKFSDLKTEHKETTAYIKSTFKKYMLAKNDRSKESITLMYAEACLEPSFDKYQNLGDWTLFHSNIHPKYEFSDLSKKIGAISYNRCYKLLNKQWPLFKELAENFDYFTRFK